MDAEAEKYGFTAWIVINPSINDSGRRSRDLAYRQKDAGTFQVQPIVQASTYPDGLYTASQWMPQRPSMLAAVIIVQINSRSIIQGLFGRREVTRS